jgi:hypothetical protein
LAAQTLDPPDVTGFHAFLPNTIGHTAGFFSVQTVPMAGWAVCQVSPASLMGAVDGAEFATGGAVTVTTGSQTVVVE